MFNLNSEIRKHFNCLCNIYTNILYDTWNPPSRKRILPRVQLTNNKQVVMFFRGCWDCGLTFLVYGGVGKFLAFFRPLCLVFGYRMARV